MRILYDGAIYQWQRIGGVNRYFTNLISRLPENFSPVLTTFRKRGIDFPQHAKLKILGFERFRPQRLSLKFENFYLDRVARAHAFDLIHPTYYTLLSQRLMERTAVPMVVTFWDMIHDCFPELDPGGHVVAMKRQAAAVADAIICISENTRNDLIERYGVSESKMVVTHLASSIDASRSNGAQPVPSRPYFLYVGARHGYKNFQTLLRAFTRLAADNLEVMLCLAGVAFSNEEEKQISELGLSSRMENYGQVDDDHLAKLYRHSLALVYPSLYEGFGLPPLEAMACGTVVVASNCASLPEVIGDAGFLFDPESVDELTEIMSRILNHPGVREPMIAKGLARAQQFSWQKTVDRTVELYEAVSSRPLG